MWKFMLIAALCLFPKGFPSTTPERGYVKVPSVGHSIGGTTDSSPDIRPMRKEIFNDENDGTPKMYPNDESATEKSEIGANAKESPTMLPEELDYSLRNKQENSVELAESANVASHENKVLSELTLNDEATKDSSKGSEMNEDRNSILTTEGLQFHFSENVTGSPPDTEVDRDTREVDISDTTIDPKIFEKSENIPTDAVHGINPDGDDVTESHVDLSDTTIIFQITEKPQNTPIDTIHGINPDENLTEEINSSFPTVSSTTERNSFSLKSLFDDEENPENITEEPFENTTQDNSTYQPTNTSERIPPAEKPTFVVSSTNYDKLTTASLFIFDEFPLHTQIKDVGKTTPNTYENTGGESDVSGELASISNITEPSTSVSIPEETEIPPTKQLLNQTYKLILKGNCSEDAFISPIFQSLNSIFNDQLDAKNSTKLMKCEYVYELNFTSNIASPESFNEVINLIKEKISPTMEVSIVNYDSTVYQISHTTPSDSESFVVPKSMVYISSAATIAMLLFMIFVIICVRNKCRRHSTSLDLSDIPHLTLSVDDYKLAPIPRPSVSFPESNRDFLHAYSNETYNRTREDDTVLTQHHFSSNVGKAYDAASGQKDSALNQEMQTFTARRCASRNRNDLKSASAHEYSSADSWDHLKGRENGKKHGLDNPAFRRW